MITKQEINAVELSPTRKDFYQIWNELMEAADKLATIWSPRSTNEADPGIVLLKLLTGIADKLNYNLDMNTREAFLPSATQLDSMRKLCDMLGYTMHHYRAATGDAIIGFRDTDTITLDQVNTVGGVYIPRFTNLQDTDESVNFVTLKGITLYSQEPSIKVPVIEGKLVECESNNDNIITINHLDDNQRYFFSEKNVAENGIFVLNVDDNVEDDTWRLETNLNTCPLGQKVYKFGFDSTRDLPYIQFPADIDQLMEDGLRIYYMRTNGLNGNIALKTLSKIVPPSIWKTADSDLISGLTADNFSVTNNSDIVNGRNPEGLNEAYNNYKKTIGTFDTLVTCRDYINKIYQMTRSTTNTTPLVSNIVVSDIRDDINRAFTLCTMGQYGICYKNLPDPDPNEAYSTDGSAKISHFDLVLYPFKTVTGTGTKTEYDNSFNYTLENASLIENQLNDNKTIAHRLNYPFANSEKNIDEIVCIKNFLQLKAKIITTKRVSISEERDILSRIYGAIYENFNARQVDFGEEIPTQTIEAVIYGADSRIKDVNLDDPVLFTKIQTVRTEYDVADIVSGKEPLGSSYYNNIILKNVLAGRVEMFSYNKDFATSYAERSLAYEDPSAETNPPVALPIVKPGTEKYDKIKTIEAKLDVDVTNISVAAADNSSNRYIKLDENEVIQFRAPNFRTIITYPAYVNYYFVLGNSEADLSISAIPATFMKLATYMNSTPYMRLDADRWNDFIGAYPTLVGEETEFTEATFNDYINKKGALFYKVITGDPESEDPEYEYRHATKFGDGYTGETEDTYNYYPVCIASSDVNEATAFGRFNDWIKTQNYHINDSDHANEQVLSAGLCRNLGTATLNVPNVIGKFVDANYFKYAECITAKADINNYYVQQTWSQDDPSETNKAYTADGLGRSAEYHGVPVNGEYELRDNDYLYINYTESSNEDENSKTVIEKTYGKGTVIKANFELIDSKKWHSSHSYTKKDGFTFNNANTNIEGMFTLDTNQQIEIREMVKVELDAAISKLFWFFKTDATTEGSTVYFCGNPKSPFRDGTEYTLQDEEYVFYSNEKETDYTYYGPGTTIKIGKDTPTIKRTISNNEVTLGEILSYGLSVDIPWVTVNLSGDTKKITIIENSFISLTADDQLCEISGLADASGNKITGNWASVTSAKYKLSGSNQIEPLPTLTVQGLTWEVRSKMDFKCGPETTQELETSVQTLPVDDATDLNATETETEIKKSYLTITTEDNNVYEYTTDYFKLDDYTPDQENTTIKKKKFAFKTNYNIQQATATIDVATLMENYEQILSVQGSVKLSDFKVKFIEPNNPVDAEQGIVSLHNYGTNYTKYMFTENSKSFTLNITMPYKTDSGVTPIDIEQFGLISLYYQKFAANNRLKVTSLDAAGETMNGIWKYNIDDTFSTEISLPDSSITTSETDAVLCTIGVKPGVAQLKIELTATDNNVKDTIVFSDLSLVNGINPKLNYIAIDAINNETITPLQQLLKDIKSYGVASTFLYNINPDATLAIDLNELIDSETMSSPDTFYDKNNIANKFVISEIDSSSLSTGITLTKSSKL